MKNRWILFILIAVILLAYWQREYILKILFEMGLDLYTPVAPLQGRITSPFGVRTRNGAEEFHNGIDVAAPKGSLVRSPLAGQVTSIYFGSAGGNQVIITHNNGMKSGYAHLDTVAVSEGQKVSKGQVIGTVGTTGVSTGPHLHFTLTNSLGEKIDPAILYA